MQNRLIDTLAFAAVEGSVFALYYLILYFNFDLSVAGNLDLLYEYGVPVLLVVYIYLNHDLRDAGLATLKSKHVFLFIAAVSVWWYVFALNKLSLMSLFYAPAIIDEINFRLVVTNFFRKYTGITPAIIIQAVMFMALYANYAFFEPASIPGLFFPLYLVDMFMMGILYGAIYYVTRNIYLDTILHNSLYILSYVVPISLAWIPYVMLPS